MADYGKCAQCAREIDSQTGYSNRSGERICIPCQFSSPAHDESATNIQAAADRKPSLRLGIGAGPLGRIVVSISEFHRRCQVANEAHAAGSAAQRAGEPGHSAPMSSLRQ